MNKINDGGPAKDKSLRAWLAGKALAGMFAYQGATENNVERAQACIRAADAVIAELEKE
jgi:hypothetical protein